MQHLGDLTNTKIVPRYTGVAPADLEKFQAFCQTWPYKQVTIGGVDWPYLINDAGEDPLVLLSGVMAVPDISWLTITHFAQTRRVIAPAYPAVKTMSALVDGIAEILQREVIGPAHVLGGSYGGFVAQAFVRRHPGLARSLMGKRLGSLLPARTTETALLHAMYEELLYHHLTKSDILNTLWRTVDYCAQQYSPQDLFDWPGTVLLVLADDDPATPEPVRAALSALYPEARLHLFHGTGHATSVLKEKEYQAVIEVFLDDITPTRQS